MHKPGLNQMLRSELALLIAGHYSLTRHPFAAGAATLTRDCNKVEKIKCCNIIMPSYSSTFAKD
jgi:hypothetical protein